MSLNRLRYLLVGTPGYFHRVELTDEQGPPWAVDGSKTTTTSSALTRCGLTLAGADFAGEAATSDDGILLGIEAVGVNFRGTEMVVLSACETGLGDAHLGEGVAGLRRAFHFAGARQVMASLWKTSDGSTPELMRHFWTAVAFGSPSTEALRIAKQRLIAFPENGETRPFHHPYHWAAFEITGVPDPSTSPHDWGN